MDSVISPDAKGRASALPLSLLAVAFIVACSSPAEPLNNPPPAVLAGAYAITQPMTLDNGATILADTLIPRVDRSVVRHSVIRHPGPNDAFRTEAWGDYTVTGRSVVLRFICLSVCSPNAPTLLTAAAMGSWGQVTRLILEEDERETTFSRVR